MRQPVALVIMSLQFELIALRFYIPLNTKLVILEMLLPANLLACTEELEFESHAFCCHVNGHGQIV